MEKQLDAVYGHLKHTLIHIKLSTKPRSFSIQGSNVAQFGLLKIVGTRFSKQKLKGSYNPYFYLH